MIEVNIELSAPEADTDLLDIAAWLGESLKTDATPVGLTVHSIEVKQSDA